MKTTNSASVSVCILGAGFNTSNLGVSALASGAVRCILNQYPDAGISLLDYARVPASHDFRSGDRGINIPLMNIRYSWRLYLANNIATLLLLAFICKFIPSRALRQTISARNRILQHILKTDMFASLAGGDSFSDIYGLNRLLYVSLPQLLVIFMGGNLIQLPQTIGPFRNRMARGIARYILRRSRQVYVRDRRGLAEVESLLGTHSTASRCRFAYDVAFALEPAAPAGTGNSAIISNSPVIGLNVSGLLFMGGYSGDNMFGLKCSYVDLVRELVEAFIEKHNAVVLLVPHVFGTSSESDARASHVVYDALKERYGPCIRMVECELSAGEVKYVIGQCDYFIGARMHACIAAVSQCVPALAIAYSNKFIGVMESVGGASFVADARVMTNREIVQMAEQGYESRTAARSLLAQNMPIVKHSVLQIFGAIAQATGSAA